MQIDLTGKNVLVTGGTRGIGRAISRTLAECGACVGAMYHSDHSAAEKTLADLNALPNASGEEGRHFALQADVGDETQAAQAAQEALERFGGALDGLVLDAAAFGGGPLVGMDLAAFRRAYAVNVEGALVLIRAVAPSMRPGASIVFISSGAGHDPMEGLGAYGSSKAAATFMAQVLALELGPQGIRVNVVSPGHTDKGDTDPNATPENYTPGQRETVNATALRRLGTAQDVANVVLFFVSDLSGFVTGQWVRVNGGRV